VPVVLSIRDVVSTHLAILASTGSGKSYTAGVLVEELMQSWNRAAVVIVDPHGEYHTMQSIQGDTQFFGDDGYKPEVKIFTPEKIKVRFSTLSEADVKYLCPRGRRTRCSTFWARRFAVSTINCEWKGDAIIFTVTTTSAITFKSNSTEKKIRTRAMAAMSLRSKDFCGGSMRGSISRREFFRRTNTFRSRICFVRTLHDPRPVRHRAARATGHSRNFT
jgi:hypothetical protein